MIFVDAHCDTITKIMEKGEGLFCNTCHIDIKRLKNFKNVIQFFAAFIDPEPQDECAMKKAVKIIDKLNMEIALNNKDILLCKNYKDVKNALDSQKIGAILSIEGGDALLGELSALRIFYLLGVRSICLTWNHKNEIADGIADSELGRGLTDFGKSVIREMNRLGMLVDLSHISEKGFWDVMEVCSSPLMVSHSNSKALCSHRRNLTDNQILAIAQNRGVIGVNFYPAFLRDEGMATIKDIIKHIEYISSLAGIENVGIGADFDGVESLPNNINGIENVCQIFNELAKLNYSDTFIRKIAGENFLRLIKEVMN